MSKYWDPAWAKDSIVVKGNTDPELLEARLKFGEAMGYPPLSEEEKTPCESQSGLVRMAIVGPDFTALARGAERLRVVDLQKEAGRLAFYFICSRPAIKAVQRETRIENGRLKLVLEMHSDDGARRTYTHESRVAEEITDLHFEAGGRMLNFSTPGGKLENDLGLIGQVLFGPKPFEPSEFDLRIHYIGRARGELRDSCALDRLENHAKYQQLLEQLLENQPNRDIWIVFGAGTTMETMGAARPGTTTEEQLQAGDKKAREILRERDRIDLTEALLINYFKPELNTQHRERLNLNGTVLKRCYEAGLTGIQLVYSSPHLRVATYTDEIPSSLYHSMKVCL